MVTKIDPKSMKNRGCVADAFLDRFLGAKGRVPNIFAGPILAAIFNENPKKGIKKGMQKSMPKKYWKLMPKGFQNDTKIDAKINENSYFSEKGWNARNYLFYNRKRGSGHLKSHQNSI